MSSVRTRFALVAVAAVALAVPLATQTGAVAATSAAASPASTSASQALAAIKKNMTSSHQVNSKPHINTMTRAMNVNVYQVASGVYAYTSSLAVDDDGSDPNPDPDHQNQTTFTDSNGKYLGAAHVPFYVLGDDCWDRKSPCPHFFYKEHNIHGRQFALMFYNGKVIGAIFGDTQTGNSQTTSENDSRELGEASVDSARLLGINDSGTEGGVDNGVTVAIFSGSSWVINGTNSTLQANAQAMVQKALNTFGGGSPSPSPTPTPTPPSGGSGSFPSGYHQLVVGNDGKCVDINGNSTSNNAVVDQYTCKSTGNTNQEFKFNSVSGGYGELQNENSGKDIVVQSASTTRGAKVIQYTQNGTTNGLWLPIHLSDGSWQFKNKNSGMCLDVTGAVSTNGVQLEQYTCKSSAAGTNQAFKTK